MSARRTGLPRSLAGRVFKYDRKTVVQPVEITPRSPHWEDVPQAQRHTRNYYLRYLPSGVRGQTIFAHDQLAELSKKELLAWRVQIERYRQGKRKHGGFSLAVSWCLVLWRGLEDICDDNGIGQAISRERAQGRLRRGGMPLWRIQKDERGE